MIDKLTKSQEANLAEYRDKWLKIGLSTDRVTFGIAKPIIDGLYTKILNKKSVPVIILRSPLEAWLGTLYVANLFYKGSQVASQVESQAWSQVESQVGSQVESQVRSQVESQVGSQVESQVRSQVASQVWSQVESHVGSQVRSQVRSQVESQVGSQVGSRVGSQVESQVRSQVESQVGSQVESQVRSQVGSQVESQVRSQVESQVWSQVASQVRSQVESQVWSQVASQVESQVWSQVWSQVASQVGSYLWPYLSGNYWAAYFSYYTFVNKSLGLKFKNQSLWDILTDTSKLSLIYPLNQVCVLSDKPVSIHMKEGLLHRDGGKSVEYSDGFGVYSLNGVRVPEYLAMTPEGSLSLDFFKKEKNADVKAEFIRKYGIERMIGLGKKLDKVKATDNDWWVKSEYELIDMAPIFTGIGKAPHLLMKNQTTGTYHLEGVDPSCKTIEEALKFRQNNRIASIMEVR